MSVNSFAAGSTSTTVKARLINIFYDYIRNSTSSKIACVVDDHELAAEMRIINNKTYRFSEIKDFESASPSIGNCSLVYINSQYANVNEVLSAIDSKKVITISDEIDFIVNGGMVGIYNKDGKLVFGINSKKAKSVGLELDSKLVELADQVI